VTKTQILAVTNLTSRFQTTVPVEVRELLKLIESDKVVWVLEDGKIVLKKA